MNSKLAENETGVRFIYGGVREIPRNFTFRFKSFFQQMSKIHLILQINLAYYDLTQYCMNQWTNTKTENSLGNETKNVIIVLKTIQKLKISNRVAVF